MNGQENYEYTRDTHAEIHGFIVGYEDYAMNCSPFSYIVSQLRMYA